MQHERMSLLALPVDELVIGKDVRIDEDPEALAELAASIAELGVLSPLVVRRKGGRWEVMAGRRRLAAARHAGLSHVPCIERPLDDERAFDAALAENLHRRRLSPLEEAIAYQEFRDRGLSQVEIAKRVGRSDFHVSVVLRILKLPPALQQRIHRGEVGYTTVLDHPERYGLDGSYRYLAVRNKGGKPRTRGAEMSEHDFSAINHWRRRHDRLLAGIRVILRSKGADMRISLESLLKLDLKPLDRDEAAEKDWRDVWGKEAK